MHQSICSSSSYNTKVNNYATFIFRSFEHCKMHFHTVKCLSFNCMPIVYNVLGGILWEKITSFGGGGGGGGALGARAPPPPPPPPFHYTFRAAFYNFIIIAARLRSLLIPIRINSTNVLYIPGAPIRDHTNFRIGPETDSTPPFHRGLHHMPI